MTGKKTEIIQPKSKKEIDYFLSQTDHTFLLNNKEHCRDQNPHVFFIIKFSPI